MILLIEDKETRESRIDISHQDLELCLGSTHCREQLDQFIENNTILDKYNMIIIHEGIRYKDNIDIVNEIKRYCSNNKNLVIFSGNSSQPSLEKKNMLKITAKNLYNNIEVFLQEYKNNKSNILMLAYGESWKLNILLNTLEKINILIEDANRDYELDFDEFEDDYNLLQIKKILEKIEYDRLFENFHVKDDTISLQQIRIFTKNLKQLIQDKSNE